MLHSSTTESLGPRNPRADGGSDSSTSELLAGVASEAKHLGEAYVELLRFEAERSLRRGAFVLAGAALAFIAALFAAAALAYGLAENTNVSQGGAFAVTSAIVLALGLAVAAAGAMRDRDRSKQR